MCRNKRLLIGLVLVASLTCAVSGLAAEKEALDSDPHLCGWWKMDDAAGTTATDSSGHGRKGMLAGDASFDAGSVAGRTGKALQLDGRDDSVRIEGYKGVAGTNPRTISIWIKTKSPQGQIVSWGTDDFGQMWMLYFMRKHVGVTPKGGYYYMAADVHDNTWHHVAAVVRKAEAPSLHDDVTLYLDGKTAEVDRIGFLDMFPIETGNELDVTIGKGFQGAIDELRIYDRPLSDEEVKALFDMGQ